MASLNERAEGMAFINFRGFWHALRLTRGDYDKPGDEGEVSHFQALASALSATVAVLTSDFEQTLTFGEDESLTLSGVGTTKILTWSGIPDWTAANKS